MNRGLSIIEAVKVPTPDELYSAAVMIEGAATVASILVGASISEREMSSVMSFFSDSLAIAAEVLTAGLDVNGGTFSRPMESKKAS